MATPKKTASKRVTPKNAKVTELPPDFVVDLGNVTRRDFADMVRALNLESVQELKIDSMEYVTALTFVRLRRAYPDVPLTIDDVWDMPLTRGSVKASNPT